MLRRATPAAPWESGGVCVEFDVDSKLRTIRYGEKKAEDRVLAAQDEVLDREPKALAQIAYELNALYKTGLDTTSFDVQTIAL